MEDISGLPPWDANKVLDSLKENPLTMKTLKHRTDRIYYINSNNEKEYLQDVIDAYHWIKLAVEIDKMEQMFENEKTLKYFVEEFVYYDIKLLQWCKSFKLLDMMIYTQQTMIEGLRLLNKMFDQLEKYPKITLIFKHVFELDRLFYKANYQNSYHYLAVTPPKEEITKIINFTKNLQPDDRVDILKTEHQSKRQCWLPGTFKKETLYYQVKCDHEKTSLSIDTGSLQIRPYKSMEDHYKWRLNLKVGDKIDYKKDCSSWIRAEIEDRRESEEEVDADKIIEVKIKGEEDLDDEWVSITDPKIQKYGTVTQERPDGKIEEEFYFEDDVDYIQDPEMENIFLSRYETGKSTLIIALLDFIHKDLNLLERISKVVKEKTMKIEIVADLIYMVHIVSMYLHRKFAVKYLTDFIESILGYINNSKEGTIRNFSKERYDAVISSVEDFMKRLLPTSERKEKIDKLKLDLILRFLFSDFLDRKLQAISLLYNFIKSTHYNNTSKTIEEVISWIRENKIIAHIYNNKSHSELIAKSSDLLKEYLKSNPSIEELQPLLTWNEAILKLVNDYFIYLPSEIQESIIENIKSQNSVSNPDALSIMKKTRNPEAWLLKNGGEGWVDVVFEKTKRKPEIVQVFEYPFEVVNKITKEMHELHDSSFKNSYFYHIIEINYLCTVLENQNIHLSQKLDFITLVTNLMKNISDPLFDLLLKLLLDNNLTLELASQYQNFFIRIMPKLQPSHLKNLFEAKFSSKEQLENLTQAEFLIFNKCFIEINDDIKENRTAEYNCHGKRTIIVNLILTADVSELYGIDKYETIIFGVKNDEISRQAIIFLGDLLTSSEDKQMVDEYKHKLLKQSIAQLYQVYLEPNSQEKLSLISRSLKMITEIMNQTELEGVDEVPSVYALFPIETLKLKYIDSFNSIKTKNFIEVPSNKNLFEFKSEICKHVNAYIKETKLSVNGKELSARYNGHLIYNLELEGDIIIDKIQEIPKVNLLDEADHLTAKARNIFKNLFNQFSTMGLMSKKQCLKYHHKCAGGEAIMQGESKVDKIFDKYDQDKDGNLTEENFLTFYENISREKEGLVWSNLEAFGVRNDLELLDSEPIVYPNRESLARTELFDDEKFMSILFELLAHDNQDIAKQAWLMVARLPISKNFNFELNLSKEYLTRYWLYVIEDKKEFEKLNKEVLEAVLKMSIETVCIGLKLTLECEQLDIEVFDIVMHYLKENNSLKSTDFYHKVILDLSLKIFSKFVLHDEKISEYYVAKSESFNKIFREGIMSLNSISREKSCKTLSELIEQSIEKDFKLFQTLFNLVYKIFDNYDLSTLTMEYFELFSNLLSILKEHSELMEKLGLNWALLTKEIISIYKSHECTETSMTSKPDQVAEGLLRIISNMLNEETIEHIADLVPFIFQQSLFPEKGRNKLKTSKSRQDAYDLINEICKFEKNGELAGGLEKLFEAGFKEIYKKMSSKKSSESFSSYYSFNESRSELGYAGIRNLGCICYMISMLQQLYMTVPFRNLILMSDDSEPECLTKKGSKEIDDNIFHQLKMMFGYLLLTEKQEYNPDEFCFSFKDFEGLPVNTSVQQDAQEFLNIFFDKLETSLKNSPFKHIFQNIFGGKSCSQTTCSGCGAKKERFENFYPLSLEIKGYRSIEESFRKYIEGEKISDYQCDSCKNKCDVIKRSLLEQTPNYFIIHLQRMCYNYDRFENEKINSRWEFPQDLNVYNYTLAKEKGLPENNGEFTYKLKGIVLHYGTADFGHYFSYIKENENEWIEFNDERVKEFDPSDIEVECFGGDHWRRESQSAYLLVYERENKSLLQLEFTSEEEKNKTIEEFKLGEAIVEETKEGKDPSESQVSKTDSMPEESIETTDIKDKDKLHENEETNAQQEPPKIYVDLDMTKVGQFVPKTIKDKIDQENDEFSFTINLSNNEFAAFIFNILSIDPPERLRAEYLELCYECLHLRQTIKIDGNKLVNVSEWAADRFTELISGYGWQFLKSFGQNWESDILSIEKSTRLVTKCLLQSVIKDIIEVSNFNEELSQTTENTDGNSELKKGVIIKFLNRLTEMMLNEVVKNWTRFAEYFELWTSLVKESSFVRRYCEEKMIGEKIMEFILEQSYPFPKTIKRGPMGSQYYPADFEYPLEFLQTLINHGYQLNEMEEECCKHHVFMNKVINFNIKNSSMIETLCKNNDVNSEKMGYMLLYSCANVQTSDGLKPVIASMHEYINIEDELKLKRVSWILGFPTFVEHSKEKLGYGSFGCDPTSEAAVNFDSPLSAYPVLHLLMIFKNKKSAQIVMLLMEFLLQLEKNGLINNLDELPSMYSVEKRYTSMFENRINRFYEEMQKPFSQKNQVEYAIRTKRFWESRPNREMINSIPQVLLGKVIEEKVIQEQIVDEFYEIQESDVRVYYLPTDIEEAERLSAKNLTTIKGNSNFVCGNLPRSYGSKFFGHYSIMRVNSSDDEDNEEAPQESLFSHTEDGWILRKIEITNKSSDDIQAIVEIESDNSSNMIVPSGPICIQIRSNSKKVYTFIKKDLASDFGVIKVSLSNIFTVQNLNYFPRQILTNVEQKMEFNKIMSSDEEDNEEEESVYIG